MQEVEQSAKHRRLIVGLVVVVDKVDVHGALFQHHLFDAEPSGQVTQARDAQQFGCFLGNLAETVLKMKLELLKVEFALYAVELLV